MKKKLAYDFWNTPEGIRSQKIFDMRDRIRRLEASNKELLEALEDCCVIAKPKNPASCCPVYRPGEHGGCSENEDGECHIWKAIQKAKGELQ